MDNSRKSITSSSTHISEQNHESSNPSPLPPQHPNPITSPPSFNVPNPMHNLPLPAPKTHEGAPYSFNPDGYIATNTEGLNDMNQTFKEQQFILEIPSGFNVIRSVRQFAERYQFFVTVLCGDGLISEVDIMYPLSGIAPKIFSGCYQIMSFSGTYNWLNAASPNTNSDFTVSLADAEDTFCVAGLVASTMKAASAVTMVVSVTNN